MEQNMHNVPDKQDKKQVIGKVWNIAIGVLCAVILWQLFSLHAERKAIPKTPDTISQTEIKTLNLSVTTMTQIVVETQRRLERLEQEIRAVSMNKLKADDAAMKKVVANAEKRLERLEQEIRAVSMNKLKADEVAVAQAMKKAQEALTRNDTALAKLYLLNAINHAPHNTACLFEYYKLCKQKSDSMSEQEWGQFRNILELAIYQIPPEEIEKIQALYDDVVKSMESRSITAAKRAEADQKEKIKYSLQELKTGKYAWNTLIDKNSSVDLNLIQERLALCNELRNLVEDDNFINEELNRTMAVFSSLSQIKVVEDTLKNAKDSLRVSPPNLNSASAQLQTARNGLSQIWGINYSLVPAGIKKRATDLVDHIASLEKNYNKLKSEPACKRIDNTIAEIENISKRDGKFTPRIKAIAEKLQEISAVMREIADTDTFKNYEKKIVKASNILQDLQRDRYKRYQEWAIKKCYDGFTTYSKWKVVTAKRAKWIIDGYLIKIDPSLLSPPVAELYNNILQKQFAELGTGDLVDYQTGIAKHEKMSLEDF